MEGGQDNPQIWHLLKKSVNGVKQKVYTIYFTGTTDNDTTTNIAHELDSSKILHVGATIFDSVQSRYVIHDILNGQNNAFRYVLQYDTTDVILENVGANLQGQNYRVKIDYML